MNISVAVAESCVDLFLFSTSNHQSFMSRRIIPQPIATRAAVANGGDLASKADDFLGRLLKYIPAEVVGLYLAVRGIVRPDASPQVMLWVALASWVLVPIYFWFATSRGGMPPLKKQVLLATIAFPVWVIAIGGPPVTQWSWYVSNPFIGSVLLVFVTVIFGWIQPPPGA